jgi:hypothetical protein
MSVEKNTISEKQKAELLAVPGHVKTILRTHTVYNGNRRDSEDSMDFGKKVNFGKQAPMNQSDFDMKSDFTKHELSVTNKNPIFEQIEIEKAIGLEHWHNIPACIVKAVKFMLAKEAALDAKMKTLDQKFQFLTDHSRSTFAAQNRKIDEMNRNFNYNLE